MRTVLLAMAIVSWVVPTCAKHAETSAGPDDATADVAIDVAPEAASDVADARSCGIPTRSTCPEATSTTSCGPRMTYPGCSPGWPLECPKLTTGKVRALLFTRETDPPLEPEPWHHPSNCLASQNVSTCGKALGWEVAVTDDPAVFEASKLAAFDVVVFLQTSGKGVLGGDAGRKALSDFIASGKGFAGTHSAAHAEYDWPWMVGLVGATFAGHPDLLVPSALDPHPCDPLVSGLPAPWVRCDEYYQFSPNPADDANNTILLWLDESCPPFPMRMGGRHPLAWRHSYGGGRSFYTALGHTPETWFDRTFLEHVMRGIAWAAGK